MNVKRISEFMKFAVEAYDRLPIDQRIQIKQIKSKISGLHAREGIIKQLLYQLVFDGAPNEDAQEVIDAWLKSKYVHSLYLNRGLDRFRNRQYLAANRSDW